MDFIATFFNTVLYPWIDLLWLPIVFIATQKKHWALAIGYVLACVVMLRLQVELMAWIGYPHGILPFLDMHVFRRGVITYGVMNLMYFAWAYYLRGIMPVIFMGHSIVLFFVALILSTVVMVL
jgi:hypothetical protein